MHHTTKGNRVEFIRSTRHLERTEYITDTSLLTDQYEKKMPGGQALIIMRKRFLPLTRWAVLLELLGCVVRSITLLIIIKRACRLMYYHLAILVYTKNLIFDEYLAFGKSDEFVIITLHLITWPRVNNKLRLNEANLFGDKARKKSYISNRDDKGLREKRTSATLSLGFYSQLIFGRLSKLYF